MDFHELKLAYSAKKSSSDANALVLEQKQWSPYNGAITNTSMVNAIANFLYGSVSSAESSGGISEEGENVPTVLEGASLGANSSNFSGSHPTNVECSLDADGCMIATVYAYPIPYDLQYNLHVTSGSVSSRHESVQVYRELIQVRLQDPGTPIRPDYPIRELRDYEWFGNVYNNLGEIVPAPDITLEGTDLYVDVRVYGTIDVTYTVEKHVYTITVTPDFDRPEDDWYKSIAYAPYDGGVEWEELTPAPSANVNFSSCGWVNVTFSDDDDLPYVDGKSRYDDINYCSGILERTRYV